ncbi:hypothetical protein V8F33_007840 [Rhypophila sp. PSN 637]
MPVPVVLATCAAVGSLITSVKSGWELRRMIKRKQEQFVAEDEAPYIFRRLRRAHREGILNDREYEDCYERFLVARAEKDLPALHRLRAHLRIAEAGAPGRALTNGSSRNSSRSASVTSSPRNNRSARSRRHSVDEYNLPDKYTEKDSPRRSASPRGRRRNHNQRRAKESRNSDIEEESESEYDEKPKTRSHRSRSTSVSHGRDHDRDYSSRREKTWPQQDTHHHDQHHHDIGAPPDQFVSVARPKRASTVTGYAVAPAAGGVPVPILLPVPISRRASTTSASAANSSRSSSATVASRRRRGEVESERDSSDTDDTDIDTDYADKRWQKKQLPSSATRESRRRPPWEKAMEEGRRPWEKKGRRGEREDDESEWDEKKDKVKA